MTYVRRRRRPLGDADMDARNAVTAAFNAAQLVKDANAAADSIKAAGGIFADEIPAGTTYDASFMGGLQTRDEWIADYLARAQTPAPAAMTLDEAVDADVLTHEQAVAIATGAPVPNRAGQLPSSSSTPAAPVIYLQGGQYVDEKGQPVPPETLDALGLTITSSSSHALSPHQPNLEAIMDPELQISDAVPFDDGSFSTDLVDGSGNTVGTVTRMPDGTTQASVSGSGGFDLSAILKKASSFLENVANAAKGAQNTITRVQNAAKGAQVGYSAPISSGPYLAAGAAVLAVILFTRRRS